MNQVQTVVRTDAEKTDLTGPRVERLRDSIKK
jgi:hypothetical protein